MLWSLQQGPGPVWGLRGTQLYLVGGALGRTGPDPGEAREPPQRLAADSSSCGPALLPQSRTYLGMSTLRDLIFKRPSRQFQYLHVLLDLSSHEKDKVIPPPFIPSCTQPFRCPK